MQDVSPTHGRIFTIKSVRFHAPRSIPSHHPICDRFQYAKMDTVLANLTTVRNSRNARLGVFLLDKKGVRPITHLRIKLQTNSLASERQADEHRRPSPKYGNHHIKIPTGVGGQEVSPVQIVPLSAEYPPTLSCWPGCTREQ